jgi:hypothetical protein
VNLALSFPACNHVIVERDTERKDFLPLMSKWSFWQVTVLFQPRQCLFYFLNRFVPLHLLANLFINLDWRPTLRAERIFQIDFRVWTVALWAIAKVRRIAVEYQQKSTFLAKAFGHRALLKDF